MSRVTIYYMRDNHTFRALPLDVEAALKIMRDERDAGQTGGMLCSKMIKDVVHAPSAAEWDDFELRAREWLEAAIQIKLPPTNQRLIDAIRKLLGSAVAYGRWHSAKQDRLDQHLGMVLSTASKSSAYYVSLYAVRCALVDGQDQSFCTACCSVDGTCKILKEVIDAVEASGTNQEAVPGMLGKTGGESSCR